MLQNTRLGDCSVIHGLSVASTHGSESQNPTELVLPPLPYKNSRRLEGRCHGSLSLFQVTIQVCIPGFRQALFIHHEVEWGEGAGLRTPFLVLEKNWKNRNDLLTSEDSTSPASPCSKLPLE